jgi:hypothetical protein
MVNQTRFSNDGPSSELALEDDTDYHSTKVPCDEHNMRPGVAPPFGIHQTPSSGFMSQSNKKSANWRHIPSSPPTSKSPKISVVEH